MRLTRAEDNGMWVLADWPALMIVCDHDGTFTLTGSRAGARWLQRHDLFARSYPRRRDALDVLAAHLAIDEPEREHFLAAETLHRVQAGLHQSADATFQVVEHDGRWIVHPPTGSGHGPYPARTLHVAAGHISFVRWQMTSSTRPIP